MPALDQEQIAVRIPKAAQLLDIGREKMRLLIVAGDIPSFHIGTRHLVLREDIRRYAEALARKEE